MAIGKQKRSGPDVGLLPAGEPRSKVAARILRHFDVNAQAMDSAEGIARFWLNEDPVEVERCLEDLTARGLLLRKAIAGSSFYSLPRRSMTDNLPLPAPAAAAAGTAVVPPGRILIVDGEPAVLNLLCESLRNAGHRVTPVTEGGAAIDLLRASPHDIIISDARLSGISGLEILRVVKQLDPSVEVILLTGESGSDTPLEALRAGAYDFLTKPIADPGHVTRTVARAIEKRRLALENLALAESLKARNLELGMTVTRMSAVSDIGRTPASLLDVNELYDSLARLVAQQLNASRVSVLMAEPDDDTMNLVASVGLPEHSSLQKRVKIGEGVAGKVAASCSPLLTADILDTELRHLVVSSRYRTPSCIVVPLIVSHPAQRQSRQFGVIAASDKHSGGPFTQQDLDFLTALSAQVSTILEHARLVREMEDGYLGALVALVQACEDVRPETRDYSRRLVELASATAREVRLPEDRVQLLLKAAALQRIGRLAHLAASSSPDLPADAARSRALTPEEVMATDQFLARIPTLREVREIVLHSAERFDTALLPFAVTHTPIPAESRILSICESFCRLERSHGSNRDATLQAIRALRSDAEGKHDRDVVEALERVIEREERA